MTEPPTLYHFTCDHARAVLGDAGLLLPAWDQNPERFRRLDGIIPTIWSARFVWLTDLSYPDVYGLGLTSDRLECDRTEHRYRVTDPDGCALWTKARGPYRHTAPRLEGPGTRPRHWWVSAHPVAVVYDPLESRWA